MFFGLIGGVLPIIFWIPELRIYQNSDLKVAEGLFYWKTNDSHGFRSLQSWWAHFRMSHHSEATCKHTINVFWVDWRGASDYFLDPRTQNTPKTSLFLGFEGFFKVLVCFCEMELPGEAPSGFQSRGLFFGSQNESNECTSRCFPSCKSIMYPRVTAVLGLMGSQQLRRTDVCKMDTRFWHQELCFLY